MRYLILITFVTLTGCTTVDGVIKRAHYVTDEVCKLTEVERQFLRERVDIITAPNKIRVECAQ